MTTHETSENRELTDCELDQVNGGGLILEETIGRPRYRDNWRYRCRYYFPETGTLNGACSH